MLLSQALFHIQAEILLPVFDLTLITAPERVTRALETIQPLARAYTQQIEQTRHAPPSPDFILRERDGSVVSLLLLRYHQYLFSK